MKHRNLFFTIAAITVGLFSCQKENHLSVDDPAIASVAAKGMNENIVGHVYTASNQVAGNQVLAYNRSAAGTLTFSGSFATGGTGAGGGLGNQGALVLSENNDWLLVVNAGSNTISSMRVSGNSLILESMINSGGIRPISVTLNNNIVYVLNAGGSGNITGFTLHADGSLQPIAGSTRPLSSVNADAAQISFVSGGNSVAVTEKATNKIITYLIDAMGIPGAMHMLNSVNATPFGFAVGENGILYVSEAAGGAPGASTVSSYQINSSGVISLIDGPISAAQTAACWVVLTNNGKYVYATNTGSGNISSFLTDDTGELSVLSAIAAPTGMGSAPIDAALSNNSKFLYVLNAGNETISAFVVSNNGSLTHLQNIPGLPDGATGLAAK